MILHWRNLPSRAAHCRDVGGDLDSPSLPSETLVGFSRAFPSISKEYIMVLDHHTPRLYSCAWCLAPRITPLCASLLILICHEKKLVIVFPTFRCDHRKNGIFHLINSTTMAIWRVIGRTRKICRKSGRKACGECLI